jgi:hypothetical protein
LKRKLSEVLIESHALTLRQQKVEEYDNDKKHRKKVAELIEEAEDGKKTALLKLIEIDNSFMFEPWAKFIILQTDHDEDIKKKRSFFSMLGDALKVGIPKKETPYKKEISDLQLLFSKDFVFKDFPPGIMRELIKTPKGKKLILELIDKSGFGPKDKWTNTDYFTKFLRRHKIID